MFRFLRESLESKFHNKVTLSKNNYMVDGEEDGPSLFKVIIMKSQLDTMATVSHIRENLSRLDEKMVELNYNIITFNEYVYQQTAALNARGQTSNDLFISVMRGYREIEDQNFRAYIEQKNNQYEENGELSVDEFMAFSENKYKSLTQRGQWNQISKDKEDIIALKAQIVQMTLNKPTTNTHNRNSDRKSNKKQKRPYFSKNSPGQAWRYLPPTSGEPSTKLVNNKQLNWCSKHHQWVHHKESECGLKINPKFEEAENPGQQNPVQQAIAILQQSFEKEDSDSESEWPMQQALSVIQQGNYK